MKKKSECEPVIRRLVSDWFDGLPNPKPEHPSWYDFKAWLGIKGYLDYLNFRSVAGPDYDAEAWFDEELKQTWRR